MHLLWDKNNDDMREEEIVFETRNRGIMEGKTGIALYHGCATEYFEARSTIVTDSSSARTSEDSIIQHLLVLAAGSKLQCSEMQQLERVADTTGANKYVTEKSKDDQRAPPGRRRTLGRFIA